MRFSIIVPAHNAEDFIEKAIDSIQMQDFVDYELLVVADKCTDATVDVVRSRDLNPVISGGGAPGLARNAGMDRANGEYLLFLDADDWFLLPDAFRRISDAIDVTGTPHLLHYGFMWGSQPFGGIQPGGGHWHHVWSRAWHRATVGDARMAHLPAGQDTVFTLAFMERPGLTHAVYDFPLMQHVTDRPGSVTHTHLARKRSGDMSMMEGLEDLLRKEVRNAQQTPVRPTR